MKRFHAWFKRGFLWMDIQIYGFFEAGNTIIYLFLYVIGQLDYRFALRRLQKMLVTKWWLDPISHGNFSLWLKSHALEARHPQKYSTYWEVNMTSIAMMLVEPLYFDLSTRICEPEYIVALERQLADICRIISSRYLYYSILPWNERLLGVY